MGEVINHTTSPLATNHTCYPSVLRGSFWLEGTQYDHALYYTYDDGPVPGGVNNSVAVAFSNDGVDWAYAGAPVIQPDAGFNGEYGSGASSACWGPSPGTVNHFYYDTSYGAADNLGEIRYKYSTDGIEFGPTPSIPTSMVLGFTPENFGGSPDVAYSPAAGTWFGVTSRLDAGEYELLLISSGDGLNPQAEWQEVGRIGTSLTAEPSSWEGGRARQEDSTLLINREGWAYVLFGAGNIPGVGQGAFTWKLYQVRFHVLDNPPMISDRFWHLGGWREPIGPLNGTLTELGQRKWNASDSVVFSESPGKVTNASPTGSHVAGLSFSPGQDPGVTPSIETLLDRTGVGWVAAGFEAAPASGLFAPGGVWVLLHSTIDRLEVYENGLNSVFAGPIPRLNPDLNFVRLEYVPSTNRLSVIVNREPVLESVLLDSTPAIGGAGFHILSPEEGGATGEAGLLDFEVNGSPKYLFVDGFEGGSVGRWSSAEP